MNISPKILNSSNLVFRLNYPARSIFRELFSVINPIFNSTIAVNEFPKSGGTWICKVLSESLEYDFRDNQYPMFGNAIIKFHKININKQLKEIVIIRDPRDVIISFYHHVFFVFKDHPFNKKMVDIYRNSFTFNNYRDIEENIHSFTERIIQSPIKPNFNWGDFYIEKINQNAAIYRYEDLRSNPVRYFSEIVNHLGVTANQEILQTTINKYDIDTINAQKNKSEEKDAINFVRKGKVGGWKEIMPSQTNSLIQESFSEVMERFNYLT